MTPTLPPNLKVIEIETTPNPNALKFNLNAQITAQTQSYLNPDAALGKDPLAESIFAITGVTSVMFCQSFVTVNKRAETRWGGIKTKVIRLLENPD